MREAGKKLGLPILSPTYQHFVSFHPASLRLAPQLPDGRQIKVGSERYLAPECMFQPDLVAIESPGIAEMLFNTINAAPVDTRSELYHNIILSGGSSMYPGLPSRLEKELKQLYLTRIARNDVTRLKVGQGGSLPYRCRLVLISLSRI